MVSKLLKRRWFKRLTVATCIGFDYLSRCIDDMSLYQLSIIKAEELSDLILRPDKNRPLANSTAWILFRYLIDNGFIGKTLLDKYRDQKDVSRTAFLRLESCFKNA